MTDVTQIIETMDRGNPQGAAELLALVWLEKGRVARDEHMVWLQVDPKLDPHRDDPRFRKLLRDVGWVK